VENLLEAWKEFKVGKAKRKDVQEFEIDLMSNILLLHEELMFKTYQHSSYVPFNISDPKPRNIHKASVRDRLLHHAIYCQLYPFFDRIFISDSYSCRIGKGTHKAINRFRSFAYKESHNYQRTTWVLKYDVRKFFASIDQEILLDILESYIADSNIVWLLNKIVKSFNSGRPDVGLPLGNLTSQLFSNIYMNRFDQIMKHNLKVEYYIRYADDFIILSHDKSWLEELLPKIGDTLIEHLHLELHPDKILLRTLSSGVDFLGWVNFPNFRVLRASTKRRMKYRTAGHPTLGTIESYLGLLSHGNTRKLRQPLLEKRHFLLYSK